MEDDASRRLMR